MDKPLKPLTALRNRSESEAIEQKSKSSLGERSLPRGEYYAHIMGPKLNKNLHKFEAVKHIKVSGDVEGELNCSEETSTDVKSPEEDTEDLSAITGTGYMTPKQTPSLFTSKGGVSSIKKSHEKKADEKVLSKDFGKPFYTPVVSRRNHQELYRQSLLTNIALGLKTSNENKVSEQSSESSEIDNPPGTVQLKPTKKLKHADTLQLNRFLKNEDNKINFQVNYIFGNVFDEKIVNKHLDLIKRGLYYSLNLLKAPATSYIESRQIELKEDSSNAKKTLILDLDETLITSCSKRDGPDKILTPLGDSSGPPIMIKIRPHAVDFLKKMRKHYEIIVFTASTTIYAKTIVNELDPEAKLVSYILDRGFCLETKNGFFIKDLRIIKNRDLKNMIIVDNLVHSFGFQIENGVPILEWTGDRRDEELKYLSNYLLQAKDQDDLRAFNKEKLGLLEFAPINK